MWSEDAKLPFMLNVCCEAGTAGHSAGGTCMTDEDPESGEVG